MGKPKAKRNRSLDDDLTTGDAGILKDMDNMENIAPKKTKKVTKKTKVEQPAKQVVEQQEDSDVVKEPRSMDTIEAKNVLMNFETVPSVLLNTPTIKNVVDPNLDSLKDQTNKYLVKLQKVCLDTGYF